ncbi:glycosyl hydrolase [Flagelloscypha sp. PMI_526]|nr:glycosyl hydrolase [Flagelloscypha sp. PMI_526]
MLGRVVFCSIFIAFALAVNFKPRPRPGSKDPVGYGFIYFTGEDFENGEQIYFAVSNGNTPSNWTEVNSGLPVLNSTLGEKGVRDPFIIKSPISHTWYIVATDLRMYGRNQDWDTASRHGSLSLAIWETKDFRKFSEERLVQVSPPTAGQTWAPEATYDPTIQKFVVYWASKLYAETDTNHTGTSYSRIMYSTTTDFKTFAPAEIWIDPGSEIIDTTVAYDAPTDTYHRFSRTSSLIVQQKSSDGLFGNWTEVTRGIGDAQFGGMEGPLIFHDNLEEKWHLFLDDLKPRGYEPFETTSLASGNWSFSEGYSLPANPRHGTVFPVTAEEYSNLSCL